jgi:putative ABC transport system permease protein
MLDEKRGCVMISVTEDMMRLEQWLYVIPLRLRSLFHRDQVERELDEELRFHIERETADNIARGLKPSEARREANRSLTDIESRKEECRDMRHLNIVDNFIQDLRYALRSLRKNPGFAALAVLVGALGIGANTAVFSVVNAVLLKPLPFQDPNHIVTLTSVWRNTGKRLPLVTLPDFIDWRANNTAFSSMAYFRKSQRPVVLGGSAHYVRVARVSPEFFGVLGVTPGMGRMFGASDAEGQRNIAVISHAYWLNRLNGSRDTLGTILRVDGQAFQVIGVAPVGFSFPDATEIWQFSDEVNRESSEPRSSLTHQVIARMKPSVTLDQAQAQVSGISERLERQYPSSNKDRNVAVTRLRDDMTGDVRQTLLVLLGAVGLVLLIACSNVATLLLAKATARTREIAMRTALGASRGRIVRQLLTESVLLALIAGAIGSIAAFALTKALVAVAPTDIPRLTELGVDAPVLAFALAASGIASLLFGLAPALYASRMELNEALKQGGTRNVSSGRAGRIRQALVVCQVALCIVLLTGAGLLIRSLEALSNVELGFRPERVLVMETSVPMESLKAALFFRGLLAEISRMPGVLAAGASMGIPGHVESAGDYSVDHLPKVKVSADNPFDAVFSVVTPGTFAVLEVPIKRGRDFNQSDRPDSPQTAIINEALAQASFRSQDPIGHTIFAGFDSTKPMTIVGVVGNTRQWSITKPPSPEIFMPYEQHTDGAGTALRVIVRSATAPEALEGLLRQKVRERSVEVPVKFTTTEKSIYEEVSAPKFRTSLMAGFAFIAMCLAMAGVYGVMAYSVIQRTSEIGLRIALGANGSAILWMIVRRGLALVAAGIALGLGASLAATRLVSSLLFETSPNDPVTYVSVIAAIGLIALAACSAPAWRAVRVDPMVALRQE